MSNIPQQTESFNEKQLRSILDNTVDGIVVVDGRGQVLSFNHACEKLFGYNSSEVIGNNISMLMPEPHRARHDEYISNYLETGQRKIIGIGREVTGLRKDKTLFPMWLSIGEVVEGVNHFFVGILRDISKQKVQEEQVEVYMQALEDSNRELDDFVYIISHDLKEPVRGIHSYSQFISEDYADKIDDAGKEKLASLIKMSKRMDELIDRLLYFSRLHKTELSYTPTDIKKVVEEVLDTLEPYLKEQNATIHFDTNLPTVVCDHARIGEIFRNLITNGIKYNDNTKKEIHIGVTSCPRSKDCPVFYVRDNGIGVPEKHYDSIFKMFKRLHGRDAYGGGTGSGLTIVKRIITQHGGKIWLESLPEKGTAFFFTLDCGADE
ncbi:MAG TPA: PAS domain S-box protein [Alphaproteobacteria bacterium]|nr:PAS domain S-box protein [Alphaproteobacteria bacterium]HNS43855.1 PAS domain S-box protein [Alphaproteobacteria bacterium]